MEVRKRKEYKLQREGHQGWNRYWVSEEGTAKDIEEEKHQSQEEAENSIISWKAEEEATNKQNGQQHWTIKEERSSKSRTEKQSLNFTNIRLLVI